VLAALLLSATGASADIIRKEDMLRGIAVTRARCDAIQDTVWVNVYGRDFCVRYYLSTAGGEGPRPVVFMQGDYFGNIRAGRWADPSSGKDIDTDNLRRTADQFSKMTKTTAIYLARIGVDGTSGSHLSRKTVLELQLMNASLDAIKQRHGFQGFHLVGQSGGSRLLVGLIEMRRDVACAVAGSGPLDIARRKSNGDPGRTYFDVVENMAPLLQNRAVRLLLVTDPVDRTVPLPEQAGFAQKLRSAGRPVTQFMVTATDEPHHGVVAYARLVAAGCVLGKTDAEIASAVSTLVRRSAEHNERRKREISAQPGIATAAAGEQAAVIR
jgi:pimeloyl-ACP methyl ester carboxylesterase